MAEHISDSEARELIHQRNQAEGKLDRIKEESKAMGVKAALLGSALGVGFLIGVVNNKEGATSEAPYNLAGSTSTTSVPLDAAAAIVGSAAVLMAKKPISLALAAGAAGGALGCWGQRLGAAWNAGTLSTSSTTTTPTTTTTSGRVGYRGGMAGRLFGPGAYGADAAGNPWIGRANPYVQHYAGPGAGY
jgi:hypothetical protein